MVASTLMSSGAAAEMRTMPSTPASRMMPTWRRARDHGATLGLSYNRRRRRHRQSLRWRPSRDRADVSSNPVECPSRRHRRVRASHAHTGRRSPPRSQRQQHREKPDLPGRRGRFCRYGPARPTHFWPRFDALLRSVTPGTWISFPLSRPFSPVAVLPFPWTLPCPISALRRHESFHDASNAPPLLASAALPFFRRRGRPPPRLQSRGGTRYGPAPACRRTASRTPAR